MQAVAGGEKSHTSREVPNLYTQGYYLIIIRDESSVLVSKDLLLLTLSREGSSNWTRGQNTDIYIAYPHQESS